VRRGFQIAPRAFASRRAWAASNSSGLMSGSWASSGELDRDGIRFERLVVSHLPTSWRSWENPTAVRDSSSFGSDLSAEGAIACLRPSCTRPRPDPPRPSGGRPPERRRGSRPRSGCRVPRARRAGLFRFRGSMPRAREEICRDLRRRGEGDPLALPGALVHATMAGTRGHFLMASPALRHRDV
jgi:hypothetical protein